MKIRIIYILLISILSLNSYSQSTENTDEQPKVVARFDLLRFGISIENKINNNRTLIFGVGPDIALRPDDYYNDGDLRDYMFAVLPYLALEYRNYLNLGNRKELAKYTDCYSGVYGAFRVKANIDAYDKSWRVKVLPAIGFQRNISSAFFWSIDAGPKAIFVEKNMEFGLNATIKLGLILGS